MQLTGRHTSGTPQAAVYGGALLVRHRATHSTLPPLGPFILVGALAAIAL